MKRFPFYALVGFFVLLYTHGLWTRLGIPKVVLEGPLLALPLAILLGQRGILHQPPPGFLFIWFYLGWSLAACIYNDEGVLRGLLYARFLVTSYLVFWTTWDSRFTRRQLLGINAVILALFFVQVLVALFYWLVLGLKREYVVGTMGYGPGGIATTFPMFAFSCLLVFFLYYNRLIFLVGAFSFFAVSHASGKLAVYYFIPLMLILGLILYAVAEGLPLALRRTRGIVLVSACALPLLVFLLSHTPRAGGLQNEAGLYRKMVSFLDYTRRSSVLGTESWYTTTRLGTSKRVVEETLQRDPSVFLFGQGTSVFGAMSGQADQGAYDKYGIIYGTVGWSQDALAIGWPAMFAHVGFYSYLLYQLLRCRRRQVLDSYGKALLLTVELGFFVFLINYFCYAPSFTVGSWVSSVYLYFLAVMLVPRYREMMGAGHIAGAYDSLDRPRYRRLVFSEQAHGGHRGMEPEYSVPCT
jgi:hypothetical protein